MCTQILFQGVEFGQVREGVPPGVRASPSSTSSKNQQPLAQATMPRRNNPKKRTRETRNEGENNNEESSKQEEAASNQEALQQNDTNGANDSSDPPSPSEETACRTIASVYKVFGFPHPDEAYKGAANVAAHIHQILALKGSIQRTEQVIQQCYACHLVDDNWEYHIHSHMDFTNTSDQLEKGELQILADVRENGRAVGLPEDHTLGMVHGSFNTWRQSVGRPPVTEYTVRYVCRNNLSIPDAYIVQLCSPLSSRAQQHYT